MSKMKVFRIPFETPIMDEKLNSHLMVPMPKYETPGAAAFDMYSANIESVTLQPGEIKLISLGIKVEVEPGFKLTIKPRSGLAKKYGITIANSPGTVDSDYRGVVGVLVQNTGSKPFVVEPLMRICQGEIEPAPQYELTEVASENELTTTERGEGGFASTGLK